MFDKFKGIQKERDIKREETSKAEVLLEVCDKIIQKYANTARINATADLNESYLSIYDELKNKMPVFEKNDLEILIHAKTNHEYEKCESKILGIYTSVLLHILTERNEAENKQTRFYINGSGGKFNRLFFYAKKIDELIIDSFVGESICEFAGGQEGSIGTLMITNCQGEDIVGSVGSYEGNIGTLIINKSKGDGLATEIGRVEGKIGTLLVNDCWGDGIAFRAGSQGGNIGKILIMNSRGHRTARFAANAEGNIGTLIIVNHDGSYIAQEAGCRNGSIGTLMVANSKGNLALCNTGSNAGNIRKIVIYNTKSPGQALDIHANQIIIDKKASEEYKIIRKEHRLNEIKRLAESMNEKKEKELFKIIDKIKETYKSTK